MLDSEFDSANDPLETEGLDSQGEPATQFNTWFEAEDETAEAMVGKSIGPFRINRVLGRGGMGVVYEAEQSNPKRLVALKVLLSGLPSKEMLRRFSYESQVLGKLRHPGIAQVYEAGTFETTHGERPYFAMEYVDGAPLTDHVAAKRTSIRDRLALLALVCDAVDHANGHGVVHRDLKPQNILVDASGNPKVLDFGIARVTNADLKTCSLTQTGQLVGTLPYMSPEQVVGDPDAIDSRTDVYGLGVVGFELLTGHLPLEVHGRPLPEAARIIRDDEPSRLSSTDRALRGDIETVIGKALEKDPARRYQRAADLASDIRSYLNDEPITARPPSAVYQLRKFAQRNKGLVAGLAGTFVALVAGICAASWYAWQADQEKERSIDALRIAEREKAVAEATINFLNQDLLGLANPNYAMGESFTMLSAVDRAAEKVGESLADRPIVQAAIRRTLAETYFVLGDNKKAEVQLRRALAVVPDHVFDRAHDRVGIGNQLGLVLQLDGRLDEAEEVLTDSLRRAESRHGKLHIHVAKACEYLGTVQERRNEFDRAREFYDRALATYSELESPESLASLTVHEFIGRLEKGRGDLAQAREVTERVIEVRRRTQGRDHPSTLRTTHNLIMVLIESSEFDRAEELNDELLDRAPRVFGEVHEVVALSHFNAGSMALLRDDFDEAEEELLAARDIIDRCATSDVWTSVLIRSKLGRLAERRGDSASAESQMSEALELARRTFGEEHLLVARMKSTLARCLVRRGAEDEAEELLREAQAIAERLAPASGDAAVITNDLAMTLMRRGNLDDAETMCRKSVEMTRRNKGARSAALATVLENLGNVVGRMGRLEESGELLREVLAIRRERYGDDHSLVARTTFNLGFLQGRSGRWEDARDLYARAIASTRASLGDDHYDVALMTLALGTAYYRLGDFERLEAAAREALRICRLRPSPRPRDVAYATRQLGVALLETDRVAEAAPLLRQQWTTQRGIEPPSHARTGNAAYELARCLERLGRHEDAIDLYLDADAAYEEAENVLAGRRADLCDRLAACHAAIDEPEEAERWSAAARELRRPVTD